MLFLECFKNYTLSELIKLYGSQPFRITLGLFKNLELFPTLIQAATNALYHLLSCKSLTFLKLFKVFKLTIKIYNWQIVTLSKIGLLLL